MPTTAAPPPPGHARPASILPRDFAPPLPLAVAYSGGADSTALLHACHQRWPGAVRAVHVHHGLQSAADSFVAHCQQTCATLDVPLHVVRLDARAQPGQSPQDAARRHRYRALAEVARQTAAASLALAQHADDQVETLVLALSRGAGLPGLAAMPAHWQRDGLHWFRPLLHTPAQALRDWLNAQHLPWVEDPSNASHDYVRNRIRAHVLPALQASFAQWRQTFARSSAHAAQAVRLLDELARLDLQATGTPPRIRALQALTPDRQANALRHWLRTSHDVRPSDAQLRELLRQIGACRTRGHRIHIRVGAGVVVRMGEEIGWYTGGILPAGAAKQRPGCA